LISFRYIGDTMRYYGGYHVSTSYNHLWVPDSWFRVHPRPGSPGEEIKRALMAGDAPRVRPAVTCLPDQTVREIGDKFMDSPVPLLVVLDKDGNTVRGIITLHDLIRAQAAIRN
jgi:hypothetical protein